MSRHVARSSVRPCQRVHSLRMPSEFNPIHCHTRMDARNVVDHKILCDVLLVLASACRPIEHVEQRRERHLALVAFRTLSLSLMPRLTNRCTPPLIAGRWRTVFRGGTRNIQCIGEACRHLLQERRRLRSTGLRWSCGSPTLPRNLLGNIGTSCRQTTLARGRWPWRLAGLSFRLWNALRGSHRNHHRHGLGRIEVEVKHDVGGGHFNFTHPPW
mmetsp:Transcript_48832/g.129432  ORF Transcript_48832/g.129432 Transcript_48832/m.129432 type:complete len:214 (-) Transcript_48832:230-871(-)